MGESHRGEIIKEIEAQSACCHSCTYHHPMPTSHFKTHTVCLTHQPHPSLVLSSQLCTANVKQYDSYKSHTHTPDKTQPMQNGPGSCTDVTSGSPWAAELPPQQTSDSHQIEYRHSSYKIYICIQYIYIQRDFNKLKPEQLILVKSSTNQDIV